MILALPLAVAVATFGLALWLIERRQTSTAGRRVAAYLDAPRLTLPTAQEEVLRTRGERSLAATEERLSHLPGWARFAALVERADARLSPVELFWGAVLAAVAILVLGAATGTSAGVVVLLELVLVGGLRIWLGVRVQRRRRAFDAQLPELLADVGSALRVGHGFNQALQAVAGEAPEPAGKEFGRVLSEARLGRPLEDALRDLGARIGSSDLQFVIDAIVVQRQVGGSLASVFEIVAESVRQRQQYAMRVRALTAMGRMSALVVLSLPAALALLLSLLNHGYLHPLFASGTGRLLVGLAAAMLCLGAVWLRALVSAEGGA